MLDSVLAAAPRGAKQPERQKPERGAPAEVLAVLAVKPARVAPRVLGRRVPLAAAGSTASLTAPAHRVALTREPEPVADEATSQHPSSGYAPAAGGFAGGPQ
jgi:hypothetical protein